MKRLVYLLSTMLLVSCTKEAYIGDTKSNFEIVDEGKVILGIDDRGIPIKANYQIRYFKAGENEIRVDHFAYTARSIEENIEFIALTNGDIIGFNDVTGCAWCDCVEDHWNEATEGNSALATGISVACPTCVGAGLGAIGVGCGFAILEDFIGI